MDLCRIIGSRRKQKTLCLVKDVDSKIEEFEINFGVTLNNVNLMEVVQLPEGGDLDEWLALNTGDFFINVNLLYGTLSEFCTESNCPKMTAGAKYEYRWADGVSVQKPIVVSAPKYVDYLMEWIEDQLNDESIFPIEMGVPFPRNFRDIVKIIFKRMFRVFAHIYHSHYEGIVRQNEEVHFNTCFNHFVLFMEFDLIDKCELATLQDLIDVILQC